MVKKRENQIDGKAIAERWLDELAVSLRALSVPLHLSAVCATDDPGLKAFILLKKKAAASVGIDFSAYYPGTRDEAERVLRWLSQDETVHGIFVELPLPEAWDADSLLSLIPADKDVDVITPEGERIFNEGASGVIPPAVGALRRVMAERDIDTGGLSVAVIGRGKLVGKPIAHWLSQQGADVRIIDVDTKEPEIIAGGADLLISGAGVPGLVTADWVKEGATVIDFGYAKKGELFVGDADAESVAAKAGAFTPVPGGMGPLVIAATLENVLTLATK